MSIRVAFDIGGTKIAGGVFSKRTLINSSRIKTISSAHPKELVTHMLHQANKLLEEKKLNLKLQDVDAIGVCVPGIIKDSGEVVKCPNLSKEWEGININDLVSKTFDGNDLIHVYSGNDANAQGLGEAYFGAGKDFQNFIFLTVSTGIGGGIIINKKIYSGHNGAAGELGHMKIMLDSYAPKCGCGQHGCLEALASGTALAKIAQDIAVKVKADSYIMRKLVDDKLDKINSEIVAQAAKEGDKAALEVMDIVTTYLAAGLANIAHAFDPEAIIIGGGVSKMGDILFHPLRRKYKDYAMSELQKEVKIIPAELEESGLFGALALTESNAQPI